MCLKSPENLSKHGVVLEDGNNRKTNNNNQNRRSDINIAERINKFANVMKTRKFIGYLFEFLPI